MPTKKLIHSFPPGVRVVSMVTHRDRVLLATEDALYELIDDKLEPVPIRHEPARFDHRGVVMGGMVDCEYCSKMHPVGYFCPNTPKEG